MKRWTKEDVQYLEESWGNVSIGKICENLNRTRYAINNKVNRLGLGKFTDNHSQGWVSYNAVLDLMGITKSKGYSYISFIQKRGLPIHRLRRDKAKIIMVNIKEFWEWAEKNQHSLDFSKLERYSFGPEPQWVDIKRQRDISKVKNINHGKWTKAEDEYLLMLLRQYRYTWREISLKLNRTYGAVQRRIVDLGYKERPIRESYSSKWSPEQLELLKLMVKNGNNYFEINKVINKSEKAIRGKVYILYGSENLDKARATKIEEEKNESQINTN